MTEFGHYIETLSTLNLTKTEQTLAINVFSTLDVIYDSLASSSTKNELLHANMVARILLILVHDIFLDSPDFRKAIREAHNLVNIRKNKIIH
jgi:hypothetical protein